MKNFEVRNQHFDRLFNTPGLKWFGQNTNHFKMHPAVRQAMALLVDRAGVRGRRGLHDEDILAADVLVNLEGHLGVGKTAQPGRA